MDEISVKDVGIQTRNLNTIIKLFLGNQSLRKISDQK